MLRVTAPTYLGVTVLAPHIQAFRARYPEVTLDLDLSDRLVDIVKERFDLAVRISTMQDSSSSRRASRPARRRWSVRPRTSAATARRRRRKICCRTRASATAS